MSPEDETPDPGRTYADVKQRCDTAVVRRWARRRGLEVSTTGGLPRFVYEIYLRELHALPAEGTHN